MTERSICPYCHKKFVDVDFLNTHLLGAHPERYSIGTDERRKGWITPYGFVDFRHPVSYEEACHAMKSVVESAANSLSGAMEKLK